MTPETHVCGPWTPSPEEIAGSVDSHESHAGQNQPQTGKGCGGELQGGKPGGDQAGAKKDPGQNDIRQRSSTQELGSFLTVFSANRYLRSMSETA